MAIRSESRTTIYPVFGGEVDLWFARLSGDGLGNSFYTYFHAVVLAEQFKATMVAPTWLAIRVGPLIRRQNSTRTYWGAFRAFAGELRGVRKFLALLNIGRRRVAVEIDNSQTQTIVQGALNVVKSRQFTFRGLHPYRAMIRERLLSIIRDPVPQGHTWGRGGYIAVHVRLGDFAQAADNAILLSGRANTRIPLSWYVEVVRALRRQDATRELYVFSDGRESELADLLSLGAKFYRSGSDISDLLAMSGASLLVGSNSTYSRWAAFLGDMPSIWLKKDITEEKPSGPDTPIAYIPMDGTGVNALELLQHAAP